jgi:hypothetical protein
VANTPRKYSALTLHPTFSTAMEELSVRSNLALTQKKLVNDMCGGVETEDFDRDYLTLCAQVVSQLCKHLTELCFE